MQDHNQAAALARIEAIHQRLDKLLGTGQPHETPAG